MNKFKHDYVEVYTYFDRNAGRVVEEVTREVFWGSKKEFQEFLESSANQNGIGWHYYAAVE